LLVSAEFYGDAVNHNPAARPYSFVYYGGLLVSDLDVPDEFPTSGLDLGGSGMGDVDEEETLGFVLGVTAYPTPKLSLGLEGRFLDNDFATFGLRTGFHF
jgi:hypothetical protein